jgi:hypothetical protein
VDNFVDISDNSIANAMPLEYDPLASTVAGAPLVILPRFFPLPCPCPIPPGIVACMKKSVQ